MTGGVMNRDSSSRLWPSGVAAGPLAFDGGPAFEFETERKEEVDRRVEVLDNDAHIVHAGGGHHWLHVSKAPGAAG